MAKDIQINHNFKLQTQHSEPNVGHCHLTQRIF